MYFELQLDTADSFDSVNLRSHDSYSSQAGWEYYDGDSWEPVPSTGVLTTYAGNPARYTLQSPLTAGLWYRRVRGSA
jgi:hypothetical protein